MLLKERWSYVRLGIQLLLAATLAAGAVAGARAQSQASVGTSDQVIGKIFTGDMLGAQVAYLEATTGPVWKIDPGIAAGTEQRVYKIDQCQVTAIVSNGAIQSLGMDLNSSCTVDLNRFISRDTSIPSANSMTFGEFENIVGVGSFASDCLEGCGNAYDPSVYDHYTGPQSDNDIEIVVSVKLVDDKSISASEKWDSLMVAQSGSDYVQNTTFNCDGKYDSQARGFFKDVRITSIDIGTDLPGPWSTCKNTQ